MVTVKICSTCRAAFNCGATEADGSCWCNKLPNIVPIAETGDCFCPDCLKMKIEDIEGNRSKDVV